MFYETWQTPWKSFSIIGLKIFSKTFWSRLQHAFMVVRVEDICPDGASVIKRHNWISCKQLFVCERCGLNMQNADPVGDDGGFKKLLRLGLWLRLALKIFESMKKAIKTEIMNSFFFFLQFAMFLFLLLSACLSEACSGWLTWVKGSAMESTSLSGEKGRGRWRERECSVESGAARAD